MKHTYTLIFILTFFNATYIQSNHEMTIFVHGTLQPAEFSLKSFIKIMIHRIEKSVYSHAAKYIRNTPYFFKGQAMQELGLKKITKQSISNGSRALAALYEKENSFLKKDVQGMYYTFGWNGLLNTRKRYDAAQIFYKQLRNELKKLSDKNIHPTIKIVSYSHGANVALNLALIKKDNPKYANDTFTINELIMFGAPIQKINEHLVLSPLFKNVFNFYSTEDNIQIMDLSAPGQLFSRKRFRNRRRLTVPNKVKQIRLRITKKVKNRFYKRNKINNRQNILFDKRTKLKHKDPGHTELWNFKWGSYWYRENFPLCPLPVVAFLPLFLDAIKKANIDKVSYTFDYVISETAAVILTKKKKNRIVVGILSKEQIQELYDLSETFVPKNYSLHNRQNHIVNILERVKKEIRENKKPRRSRVLISSCDKAFLKSFP